MKVYFTCSTADFLKYRETYFAIRNQLINESYILTRDWLAEADDRLRANEVDLSDIKTIYKSCVNAIKEADLVIIEDTISNFSTGHQITLALRMRKPVLVLWQGKKHRQFKQMFIHGIEAENLEVVEYDRDNLSDKIDLFLRKYENSFEQNRFHLILSGTERNYLDWVRYNSGKSRNKIIRESIKRAMDVDIAYNNYLLHRN